MEILLITRNDCSAAIFENSYTLEEVVNLAKKGVTEFPDFDAEIKEFPDVTITNEFLGWLKDNISDSDFLRATNVYIIDEDNKCKKQNLK